MEVRLCSPVDEPSITAFLAARTANDPSALLILGNLLKTGGLVEYSGQPFQGQFYGLFAANEHGCVGVAVRFWTGLVVLSWRNEHVDYLADVNYNLTENVTRMEGSPAVVQHLATLLAPNSWSLRLKTMLSVDLASQDRADLDPDYFVDRLRPIDLPILVTWRSRFLHESSQTPISNLPASPSSESASDHTAAAEQYIREMNGSIRVLIGKQDEQALAMLTYNSMVPSAVLVGNMYVPVEGRRKGYGRQLLLGCLKALKKEGVQNVMVYTDNVVAEALYRAVGFTPTGHHAVLNLTN